MSPQHIHRLFFYCLLSFSHSFTHTCANFSERQWKGIFHQYLCRKYERFMRNPVEKVFPFSIWYISLNFLAKRLRWGILFSVATNPKPKIFVPKTEKIWMMNICRTMFIHTYLFFFYCSGAQFVHLQRWRWLGQKKGNAHTHSRITFKEIDRKCMRKRVCLCTVYVCVWQRVGEGLEKNEIEICLCT